MVSEMSAEELKGLIDGGRAPQVLDVREPWEIEIAAFPGAIEIPMNEIPERFGELDRSALVAVLCRSGARSLRVAQFLEKNGFSSVANVTGGILAWGERIDPSVRAY
jgi:rhodanese-related sulfurtransferase